MLLNSTKLKAIGLALFLLSFCTPGLAHAETYFGLELGLGVPAGTGVSEDSGLVLGATAGFQVNPELALALTYQHDGLSASDSAFSLSESQLLAEANFFNLFFLASGLHAGPVFHRVNDTHSTALGIGAHSGLDIRVTNDVSVGFSIYWTYVNASEDKHSLFNFLIPVKYWF